MARERDKYSELLTQEQRAEREVLVRAVNDIRSRLFPVQTPPPPQPPPATKPSMTVPSSPMVLIASAPGSPSEPSQLRRIYADPPLSPSVPATGSRIVAEAMAPVPMLSSSASAPTISSPKLRLGRSATPGVPLGPRPATTAIHCGGRPKSMGVPSAHVVTSETCRTASLNGEPVAQPMVPSVSRIVSTSASIVHVQEVLPRMRSAQ